MLDEPRAGPAAMFYRQRSASEKFVGGSMAHITCPPSLRDESGGSDCEKVFAGYEINNKASDRRAEVHLSLSRPP